MSEELNSTALGLLVGMGGLSLTALFYLFQKHIDGRSLVAYEPRRRVPWGAGVALIALFFPLLSIASFLASGDPGAEPAASETASSESTVVAGWANFVFMISFVLVVGVSIANFFQADAHDLGLPTSGQQLLQDVGLGVVATLAALLPIYVVQLVLITVLQNNTPHPLVKEISDTPSPGMLAAGFAMAVIGAPLFEEFTFRALLQGWLERREDEIVGHWATERPPQYEPSTITLDEDGMVTAEAEPSLAPQEEVTTETSERPLRGWIPDLPHGWTPVLISAVFFGLAHLGHGVAPISLVLFGIVLGYLYQRTHRLVPSITAHMVFNAHSMMLLWLQLGDPPAT